MGEGEAGGVGGRLNRYTELSVPLLGEESKHFVMPVCIKSLRSDLRIVKILLFYCSTQKYL